MDGLRLKMTIHPFGETYGLATMALRTSDLLNYTTIDPMVQRKLSAVQRRKIAAYLQERELEQIFFGPIILSLRDVSMLEKQGEAFILRHGSKLSILDGQHRVFALGHVNEQLLKETRKLERQANALKLKLRKKPEETALLEELDQLEDQIAALEARRLDLLQSQLSVQIYIGLGEEEEKQLFGDINSKMQIVSKELGHSFDSTDPLNLIIQQIVDHNIFLKAAGVEKRSNLTSFNKNFTSYSWLYSTASMLLSGKAQPSHELSRAIRSNRAAYVEVLHQFYNTLLPLLPEQPGLGQYTSASRVMQESIALYAHPFLKDQDGQLRSHWTECLQVLNEFDWSHENERLVERFGLMDNGKLNLVHEKSLRKHNKMVQLFQELGEQSVSEEASSAKDDDSGSQIA